jgi:hypothetical protein
VKVIRDMPLITCEFCGKQKPARSLKSKYCSSECYAKTRKGKGRNNGRTGFRKADALPKCIIKKSVTKLDASRIGEDILIAFKVKLSADQLERFREFASQNFRRD